MKNLSSKNADNYIALRWCLWTGAMLAWLTVLIASFSYKNHWLERYCYIAVVLFSTANLFLVVRNRKLKQQSSTGKPDAATSASDNAGGASQ